MGKDQLLAMIRGGQELTARQRLALVVSLSMPAMLSQLSTIVEEYVDAMMSYTPTWVFFAMIVMCLVGGTIGGLLGAKVLNKHFRKAGMI